jgi:hypothetical protein
LAGLAALLASGGVICPDKVRQAIETTARDLGPSGWDQDYGWGFVDAPAALAYRVIGDFGGENVVNARDLAVFSSQWLQTAPGLPGDLNADNHVDFDDFRLLAAGWGR